MYILGHVQRDRERETIVQHDVRKYHMSCSERLFAPDPNPSVMTITCVSMRLEPLAHLFSFLHHQKQTGSLARGRWGPLFGGFTTLTAL